MWKWTLPRRLKEILSSMLPHGQVFAALLVCASRFYFRPIQPMGRDWFLLLSLYWLGIAAHRRVLESNRLLIMLMAYLLGIYLQGHLPHALAILRSVR
jgi:hypothetical protein